MTLRSHILGCLLGTAVGDAAGLRCEGLSPRRARRLYGDTVQPTLLLGRGMCSDDTEHTVMVARALAQVCEDPDEFEAMFARQLRPWLLTMPAGIGLATLRSCLKLLVGVPPSHSGVFSAGNGPAMRAALLGVCAKSEQECRELVRRSTRVTHTDPTAEEGAWVVAEAARLAVCGRGATPLEFVENIEGQLQGDELRRCLGGLCQSLKTGLTPAEFAQSQGWSRGVSGYVNHTVPAALYCWVATPNDFRQAVTSAVHLGGDADSVAAITGAIAGANLGAEAIPREWIDRLGEWPRNVKWLEQLAEALSVKLSGAEANQLPSMHWPATAARNVLFAAVVLLLGFRRLFPPY
ncbi:ADP-ribosylglycohydrolase family protein [Aeoliella sp. ICT_H6.2]|uniref:ADP-ribosylglycohydrolase family protein n=1 Tax=Aeoliella straminimaris TaxID=2954799 RepID=A0A9X2F6F1_9BACT|nr:ADP-ribosylglycohydrolase family protein [Aeoliella straminimaris]MCO6042487.1 ADP-ribosylglycohydrolase family protein [Aeoliella straminimaris]